MCQYDLNGNLLPVLFGADTYCPQPGENCFENIKVVLVLIQVRCNDRDEIFHDSKAKILKKNEVLERFLLCGNHRIL